MIAEGLERGHGYIGDTTLKGKLLRRAFLHHDEITAGGELHFAMQAEAARPYSVAVLSPE